MKVLRNVFQAMRKSVFLVLFLFGFLGSECGQVTRENDSPPPDTKEDLWEQRTKIAAANAEGQKKAKLIPVKEGDIIQYPLNAEPIEVEAEINSLSYACTLMPGDSFETIRILDYDHFPYGRSEIKLKKKRELRGIIKSVM